MQTIVVAPLPPQSSPQVSGGQSGQSSSESTFAPTLAKAIDENSRSETNTSSDTRQTPPNTNQTDDNKTATHARGNQESSENLEELEHKPQDSETVSVLLQNTVGLNLQELQLTDSLTQGAPSDSINHESVKTAEYLSRGNVGPAIGNSSLLSAATDRSQLSIIDTTKTVIETVKLNVQTQQGKQSLEPGQNISAENFGFTNKFADNQIRSGQNTTGNYQGLLQQNDLSRMQMSNYTLETVQKNDSISWSQLRQQNSQELLNFSGPVKINMDNGVATNEISTISTEKIMAELSQIPVELENARPLRNPEQLTLRQDISSQYLDAKIESKQSKGGQEQSQQFLDAEQHSGKPNMMGQTTGKLGETSTESTFSQSLNQIPQDKVSQPSPEPIRPSFQPFSSAVSENELLEQVTNKFRISQHLQNSKLVMKLHPAELGNLKIDIHLKDGTINANIVAQSQQVQETLEKNMPRLKALMEQQGLLVENITIRLDSDVPTEHNLFDEQLAHSGTSFSDKKPSHSRGTFTMDLDSEEIEDESQSSESGVNVTV